MGQPLLDRLTELLGGLLNELALARHLLERGILDPEAVVEGRLTIRRRDGRNVNFALTSERGPGLFVKHGIGRDGLGMIEREARAYTALRTGGGAALAGFLPPVREFDRERSLLVLEHVGDGRTLRDQHRSGRYSLRVASAVGGALAAIHDTPPPAGTPDDGPAWILRLHQPWVSWIRDASAASLRLMEAVQSRPEFGERLDALRADWRPECLTHRDFKWDNCLAVRGPYGRATGVRIVDWETAGVGDPAWDAGSALGDYLACWLFSIPVTGQDPPERFADLARRPLDRMRPALRALWTAYARGRRLTPVQANALLVRSTRYAAARLLQTGYEQAQMLPDLPGTTRCLLQVALNLLRRPHEGAVRLLGIGLVAEPAR